jgi:hypothetical protein
MGVMKCWLHYQKIVLRVMCGNILMMMMMMMMMIFFKKKDVSELCRRCCTCSQAAIDWFAFKFLQIRTDTDGLLICSTYMTSVSAISILESETIFKYQ